MAIQRIAAVPNNSEPGTPASIPPDPQGELIDRLSDDQLLDALGPDWSKMSAAERAAYGRTPAEPDPALDVLERFASAKTDLAQQIEDETLACLDRSERLLLRLEARVRQNLYRAARERIVRERGA